MSSDELATAVGKFPQVMGLTEKELKGAVNGEELHCLGIVSLLAFCWGLLWQARSES